MSVCPALSIPTTKSLSFVDIGLSVDHRPLLLKADSSRALIRTLLKEHPDDSSGNYLAIIKAIEDYLPYLFSIIDLLRQESAERELKFCWKLPSWSKLRSATDTIKRTSIEFERGMILLTYIHSFMCLADQSITRKSDDVKWKLATAHLIKAQSVVLYLMNNPLQMEDIPWDLQYTTMNMLFNIISGSLHLLVLCKDVEEAVDYYSIPKTSASVVLMSRVAIFANDKFASAQQLLDSHAPDALKSWLKDIRLYTTACVHRLLAMQAASKNNIGMAIAYTENAIDSIGGAKIRQVFKSNRESNNSSTCSSMAEAKSQLKENLVKLLNTYKAENDAVAFQKIPKLTEIDDQWPSGREVVGTTAEFIPPIKSQVEPTHTGQSYSGQGQYF